MPFRIKDILYFCHRFGFIPFPLIELKKRYAYLEVGNVGNSRLFQRDSIVVFTPRRGLLFYIL